MTTNRLDLSNGNDWTVEFYFMTKNMKDGDKILLQYGSEGSYNTVATYTAGSSFSNESFYVTSVVIPGPLSSSSRLRLRCKTSRRGRGKVFIDDITISGCPSGAGSRQQDNTTAEQTKLAEPLTPISDVNLFPKPTRGALNVTFTAIEATDMQLMVTNYAGKVMQKLDVKAEVGKQNTVIDAGQMPPGMYILHMITKDKIVAKKFVVTR